MRFAHARPAVLLTLLLFVTGCLAEDVAEGVDADQEPTGEASIAAPQEGDDLEVPLEIVAGPEESALAFVPVMIGQDGPYSFALDTGASNSVLDASIAEELDLEQVGRSRGVTGVTGDVQAILVQIEEWRTGDVDLGARPVIVLDLSGPGEGTGLQGLLGSDVLSAFGVITIDYDAGVLRLRPRSG